MELAAYFTTLSVTAGLLFFVYSMLVTGLNLTRMAQTVQPSKNARLVIPALLANFVLVPLPSSGIAPVRRLDEVLEIGQIMSAHSASWH